jgi:tRNA-splicing ligase RtcB
MGIQIELNKGRVPVKAWTRDIDLVMDNQRDLVEVVHSLKQVLCVKG